ncbi:MAG: FapA family protein [Lachnospiraceae bacterium]|nr:FapA family protein [Lachnospiraceae bacterium]
MTDEITIEQLGESIKEIERFLSENDLFESEKIQQKAVGKQTVVRVTKDLREAWLYLARPVNGETYSKEGVIALLEQNGVREGYIMSNISAMVKKGVYERSIKVAMAKDCVQGSNGRYEFTFDILENKKNPKIREDGSVDYTSVNLLTSVSSGDKICTYYPAVQGTPGYLVDGTVLEPAKTADLPSLKGKGFEYDDFSKSYYSIIDGKIDVISDYEIQIRNVHEVKGDVNQLNPKVEFNGDIEIMGNVESGAVIRSTRSITISGVVEAAEIYAGGDIVLKRGIQGSNKAKIVCNGTLYADFIEHTTVKAKGDVKSNSILNSEILSDGKVILTGKRGTLIGGYTHARKGIQCANLGSSSEVKTVAHVGLETKDYLKNQDVLKNDAYLRDKIKVILDRMNHIISLNKVNPLDQEELEELNDLNIQKNDLTSKIKDNNRELEIISKIVEEARCAEIRVEEHVYKGVIIAIDASRMPIRANTQYMVYRGNNGVIEGNVIILN